MDRDGRRCVSCGMNEHEHMNRWGRPITIDHKDRDRKNNNLDNLQTLCLSCHGKKDISGFLIVEIPEQEKEAIRSMRRGGKTYREISIAVGRSIAVAWKYGKSERQKELI